jgi:hypothetical protein
MEEKTRVMDRGTWEEIAPEFRRRWRADHPNALWDDYEPWYRYGYEMASDPRYHGRRWVDAEVDLQERYPEWAERRGYRYDRRDNMWQRFKENVREAWMTIAGR